MHSDPCDSAIENRFKPFVQQRVGKRPHFHVFIHSFIQILIDAYYVPSAVQDARRHRGK